MITDIHTEDITYCNQEEAVGGIATRIWYAPQYVFNKFILPTSEDYTENRLIKKENITVKGLYKLNHIDVFLEQNALSENLFGSERRWKNQSELEFNILKMKGKHLAFLSAISNSGLVFFIPDSNGNTWVFGCLENGAYMTSGEGNTNKKYEEDSLVKMKFKANTCLYQYESNVTDIKRIGAFTFGFSKGFKI